MDKKGMDRNNVNRKRMRRGTGVLLALLLGFTASQTAMGAASKTDGAKQAERGYEFVYGETRVAMAQDAAAVLDALGKADSVFEQDSCAYQGKERVYSYADLELSTYSSGKNERISSIYLLDDKVQTEEGIKIGSTYDDMVKAYGKEYTVENEVYRYVKHGTELSFYMTDRKIDAIEYMMLPSADQGIGGKGAAAAGR